MGEKGFIVSLIHQRALINQRRKEDETYQYPITDRYYRLALNKV